MRDRSEKPIIIYDLSKGVLYPQLFFGTYINKLKDSLHGVGCVGTNMGGLIIILLYVDDIVLDPMISVVPCFLW
jgi:hypothetical protein